MKAFIVCVEYSDILRLTIERTLAHISDMVIVTTQNDAETRSLIKEYDLSSHVSDSFYAGSAIFNKWLPLSEALEKYADGWTCVMDADILLPEDAWPSEGMWLKEGNLYTPRRRMFLDLSQPIPYTGSWADYQLPAREEEFAGYCQIFHAEDRKLGDHPWYQTDWKHAGGADTFFQAKWSPIRKERPPFEVLHLGQDGVNWCGRVTPFLDGRIPEGADIRKDLLDDMIKNRSGRGESRYRKERL